MRPNKNNSDRVSWGSGLTLLLLLGCWLGIQGGGARAAGQEAKKPAEVQNQEVKSFIKTDILPKLDPSLARIKRDIFRTAISESASGISSPRKQVAAEIHPEGAVKSASVLESLNLICLGLLNSGSKMLALILVDGQAITLGEGEELIPGIKLVKITSQEVLFRDDQGNSRKIKVKES